MAHFTKEIIEFFSELENNNNRDWFNANKPRYLKYVKEPFEAFIEELIHRISEHDDQIRISPKEAIFRIYRDVRFSKDKLPYKVFTSAVITPMGRKDLNIPGFYLEIRSNVVNFYAGAYELDKNALQKLREFLSHNLDSFKELYTDKEFKKLYGEILGDKNKRLPKEFQEVAEKEPLIANKQFYYHGKIDSKKVTSKTFIDTVMKYYLAGKPLCDFFKIGIGGAF